MSTEIAKPRVGAAVIAIWSNNGQPYVLLGQRAKEPVGKWVFPGGGVQPFERLVDAACRELHEETGLRLSPGALWYHRYKELITDTEHRLIHYFFAHIAQSDLPMLRPGDDLHAAAWVTPERLGEKDLTAFTKDVLDGLGADFWARFS